MDRGALTFTTYPPLTNPAGTENELYDDTMCVFDVREVWFYRWVYEEDGRSWRQFLDEYTWDDTLQMYELAIQVGAVLREEIVPR